MSADSRSLSVKLDGRASIEHQLDIHVQDLVEANDNPDIGILDVLEGLHYVMEYRVHGGKMPALDAVLMSKLAKALLGLASNQEGNLLFQKPTLEADLAFNLFGDFLAEVEEFRKAVGQYSAFDLASMLKIHRRCGSRSTLEQRHSAAGILGLLTTRFPRFSDWKELVKEEEHDDVEKLTVEFPDMFKQPTMPVSLDLYPPSSLYFDKNAERLAEMFQTSTSEGLSTAQVERLRSHYGSNKLPVPPSPSILWIMYVQLTDFMIIILLAAAIINFATDEAKSAGVLLFVVVLNVIIGTTQEFKANRALEALTNLSVPKATVIRNGKPESMDAGLLVPGDLVVLEEGDAVPADLRLCEVSQLEIIESILTGESLGVVKSIRTIRRKTRRLPLGECKGNAFMTTVVSRGRGRGIVVRTGLETEIGRISSAISSNPSPKTSLEINLASLGKWLVLIAIILCLVIIGIGIGYHHEAIKTLKIGVSLAVSVIPEGLVAVVTVAMAFGVHRMLQKNAIVRKLPSVETLGSVNVICSDKTGTLTEGKMGTQQLWTSDNTKFTFSNSTSLDPTQGSVSMIANLSLNEALLDPHKSIQESIEKSQSVSKEIAEIPTHFIASMMIASVCNNSSVGLDAETNKYKSTGDPTEVAMTTAAAKCGLSRELFLNTLGFVKLGEYAFDSDRKLMSMIVKGPASLFGSNSKHEECFVLVKGAPEGVLQHCKSYLAPSEIPSSKRGLGPLLDSPLDLSDQMVALTSEQSAHMAGKGLRVLGLAIRRVSLDEATSIVSSNKASDAETGLTFVGLIGLIDPPKAGVKESVALCKKAGIRVIMITGDHIATATAIAKQLGIIDLSSSDQQRSMKGYEIDILSEESLASQSPFPVVFARVSPDNKLKIVKALQSKGLSVAMTGDGVNDAPAIKKADIGIAMGLGGTELTKQAADLVLADDNFSTIVDAAKEGRQVFDNIQKFVVYLLSCNSAEIFLFMICAIINTEVPFTNIQILWANIIADIPPATALGLEPPEVDIMERPPRPVRQGVVTLSNWLLILFQGLLQSMISFGVFMLALEIQLAGAKTISQAQSLTFVTLTTMQLFQGFLSRSVIHSVFTTGVTSNRILIVCVFGSMLLVVMGAEVPGMNSFLELESVGVGWVVVLVCCLIQFVGVETFKLGQRLVHSPRKSTSRQDSSTQLAS